MNASSRHLAVALSLIVLTLAATASLAGTARVLALGDDDQFFADPANVQRWYASLVDHPDLVFLELGDLAHHQDQALAGRHLLGHGGGAHAQLDADGAWGTAAVFFEDHLSHDATDGAFGLLWGRRLGGWQLGMGGRFTTFGQSRAGTGVGDRVDSEYVHQYNLGLARRLGDGLRVDVAGELVNTINSSSGSLFSVSDDRWQTFGLRTRAFVEASPLVTVVPVVDYARILRAVQSEVLGGPADRDGHLMSLGVGANIRPDQDTLVLVSGEYRVGGDDLRGGGSGLANLAWQRSERTFYQLRGRVAVERSVLPWLTMRMAVQYVRLHEEASRRNDATEAVERRALEAVATPLAFGLSARRGTLSVDLAYNDTAPVNAGLQSEGLFSGDGPGLAAATLRWSF
jgi:hypothetical protein